MKKFLKRIFKIIFFIGLLILVFIEGLIFYAKKNNFDIPQDYVLVLGAKANNGNLSKTLIERLNSAYSYLEKHKNSTAILCGGKESGNEFSQAEYMRDHLIKMGIDENRLIVETKSVNTFENIKFALEKMNKKPSSVMVITSDYHIFRAKFILYRFGVLGYSYPAKVPKNSIVLSYCRETLAVIKTFLFDRPTEMDIKNLHAK